MRVSCSDSNHSSPLQNGKRSRITIFGTKLDLWTDPDWISGQKARPTGMIVVTKRRLNAFASFFRYSNHLILLQDEKRTKSSNFVTIYSFKVDHDLILD